MQFLANVALAFVLVAVSTADVFSQDSCQQIGEDQAPSSLISIRKAGGGIDEPLGVGIALGQNGLVLTAAHIATSINKSGVRLVAVNSSQEKFDVQTVVLGKDSDWALVQLVGAGKKVPFLPNTPLVAYDLSAFQEHVGNGAIWSAQNQIANRMSIGAARLVATRGGQLTNLAVRTPESLSRCPASVGYLIRPDETYGHGDSGSPILDSCGRLVGITSKFRVSPTESAKDIYYSQLRLAAAVNAFGDGGGYDPTASGILDRIDNSELERQIKQGGLSENVLNAFTQFQSTLSSSNEVIFVPMGCILNELLAWVGTADRKKLKGLGFDRQFIGLLMALRSGRVPNNSPEVIMRSSNAPVEFGALLLAKYSTSQLSFSNSLETTLGKLIDLNEASALEYLMQVYQSQYGGFALDEFLLDQKNYVEDVVLRGAALTDIYENMLAGAEGNKERVSAFSARLIESNEFQMAEMGRRLAGEVLGTNLTSKDAQTIVARNKLDDSIYYMMSASAWMALNYSTYDPDRQRYATFLYADLVKAIQQRRRQAMGHTGIRMEGVKLELKISKMGLTLNPRNVLLWDLAATAFRESTKLELAWLLSGVALYERCSSSCKALEARGSRSDTFVNNLYSNVYSDFENLLDGGVVSSGFTQLLDLVEQIDSSENDLNAGGQGNLDGVLSDLQHAKRQWLKDETGTQFSEYLGSACIKCPPIGTLIQPDGGEVMSRNLNVEGLSDWLYTWNRQVSPQG
jgi:Trypsin-like peptidase domain